MLAWCRKSYLGPAEIMYMCDGPIETVECIWVNIWCMLDWIWSQNCRNTLFLHTAGQLGFSLKGVFLFSCITLHVCKKSTFTFKFAINVIKPPKVRQAIVIPIGNIVCNFHQQPFYLSIAAAKYLQYAIVLPKVKSNKLD